MANTQVHTPSAPGAPRQSGNTRQIPILVVDDELGPRESLRIILKPDYTVVTAANGFDALDILEQVRPKVILSDIRMPGMDGIELMYKVREQYPDIPFIIITGCASVENAQEAVRGGAFDYIIKPYKVGQIRDVVTRALEQVRRDRQLEKALAEMRELNQRLEEQMKEMDRRAALGELSAELVHELNNPLCILQGYVTLLDEVLGSNRTPREAGKYRQYVEIIRTQIQRCAQLTRNYLSFARGKGNEWEQLKINDVFRDTAFLLRVRMQSLNIELIEDLEARIPAVWGQRVSLQQVFYNLLLNAIHVLEPTGGTVRVTTRRVRDEAGPAVEIRVSDNGPGILPSIKDRIFDTFFSTKSNEKGTGLGLAICRRIVQEHAGRIWVESEPGNGATFIVRLPHSETPPQAAGERSPTSRAILGPKA